MKITYVITVKQLVPDSELREEDREENPTGEYEEDAESEDEALDEFHFNIPIKCLDDFEIYCVAKVAAEVERDLENAKNGYFSRPKDYVEAVTVYVDEEEPSDELGMAQIITARDSEESEPEESDMADIRNYEKLAPDCKFTLDIVEAMDALHEGKKVQCSLWGDEEWIMIDEYEGLVDESDRTIGGGTLVMCRDFNWRIIL